MLKTICAALLVAVASTRVASAQDAQAVIATAQKTLGADTAKGIVITGTASDVNFLQTKNINGPWPLRPIANYTRAIDLSQMAMRSTGSTNNQGLFGGPPVPGTFNQVVGPQSATYAQQVEYWITPWGFLEGATANNATVSRKKWNGKTYQVVSWNTPLKAPSGLAYTLNGYVSDAGTIDRVETWVDHDMLGDMLVAVDYQGWKDYPGGAKGPQRIVQQRGGFTFFETNVSNVEKDPANLAQLLTPPAPAGGAGRAGGPPAGAAPAAPPSGSTKVGDGVYRINGAYNALAVEFKDYVAVVEGPQNVARGQALVDEVKKLFPTKPIRYVINSHPHSDHAGGLAPFVSEGAIVVTHQNNRKFMETTFGAPRTLVGDKLAQTKRKPKVEGVAEKRVITDGTQTLELYHIIDRDLEKVHSDGIMVAFLPKQKILFQADFTLPVNGAQPNPFVQSLGENLGRLKLDFDQYLSVHNTPLTQTRADLMKATGVSY